MSVNLLSIDIQLESDVVLARQKARAIAAALKFDTQDQTRIATAVSEIARNTFQYGSGGRAEFRIENGSNRMLLITFCDKGKGIPHLDEIMRGRYISPTGMGLGIIGTQRLMDSFSIESNPRTGTTVRLGKKIPPQFAAFSSKELNQLLSTIEKASEDPYQELRQQNKELMRALEELNRRQEELAQLNNELDETNRGVVALYAELNDRADFLRRASELKTHFLSNMSHEFRTPLNSITALTQILLDRLDGDLTAEQEKQVRFIRKSAQDLTDLVNDLLDLAKVEAGKVTIRPVQFQIESLLAALRGMLRPLLVQNSSVSLVFEDPVDLPEMYSDDAKISQILRNFISNALKFTDRGEVRVSATRGKGNTIIFAVSDTGVGIATEDQELIFQEWMQVEGGPQRKFKGSGLGLPLSRKFAQLLGGDVHVKSELGVGSTFYATIPIQFGGPTTVSYVPDEKYALNANKIPVLVVEDNRETLFIYQEYLNHSSYQLVAARDLKEARRALKEFRPSAVVLDVLLEGEHSWDLLQDLKNDPETADIPVLVVTVVDNKEKALALGADAFHAKPLERKWLIEKLDAATRGTSRQHILLVDDDEVSRYLVKNMLSPYHFRFTEVAEGQDAIRTAAEEHPDLVILDLVMPGISGFEVLRKLQASESTSSIPVIVHTSKHLSAEEKKNLGQAIAIISKDANSRELSLEHFQSAFKKAGIPFSSLRTNQEQRA